MHADILINLLGLLWIASMRVMAQEVDECPKDELACHDIMNGSQCIEQLVIEKQSELTKEAMVKCVEHEGTASTLPGATKYCRCPGCHTAPINAVIKQMFPPPCG